MLNQLLSIKRNRERTMRTTLCKLHDEERKLCLRLESLHANRHRLHAEWRQLAAISGHYDQAGFEKLRASLAKLETEDQSLLQQQDYIEVEQSKLALVRIEQERLLRRNLCEQAKLSMLIAEPNTY